MSPCFLDVCEDINSNACQEAISSYCAANPMDAGCGYYAPVFLRNASERTRVSFYLPTERMDVWHVYPVHKHCTCDDTSAACHAPEFELTSVHFDPQSRQVDLDFAVFTNGAYRVCDDFGTLTSPRTETFVPSCDSQSEPFRGA